MYENLVYQAFCLNIMDKRHNRAIKSIFHDRRHRENWFLALTDDLIISMACRDDVCEVYNPLTPGYAELRKITHRWRSVKVKSCPNEYRWMIDSLTAILHDQQQDVKCYEQSVL